MDFEHVLVAGGGSGGHVFPALAVAEQLVARGWRMSWLGRHEGMERDLVKQRGLTYYGLPARAIVGRSVGERALAMGGMGVSAIRARQLIRRIEAGVVLGTRGLCIGSGSHGSGSGGPSRRPVGAQRRGWCSQPFVVALGHGRSRCSTRNRISASLPCRGNRSPGPVGVRHPGQGGEPGWTAADTGARWKPGCSATQRAAARGHRSMAGAHPGMQVTHQVGATQLDETQATYERQNLEGAISHSFRFWRMCRGR